MILHPLYDTTAKVFVVTIGGDEVEAKSISGLLAKVGLGHTVKDYYPMGVPAELLPKGLTGPVRFQKLDARPLRYPKKPPGPRSEPAGEVLAEKAPMAAQEEIALTGL